MKRISKIFIIRIIGAVLGISFSIVLARVLGANEVGIYFQALNIAIIGTIVGRMGLDNAVLKFTAIYLKNNEWDKVNGVYKQAFKICLITSVIITIILYFISGIIAEYFYKDIQVTVPIQLMVITIIPFSLMTLHAEILKGLEKTSKAVITQHVIIPLTCLTILLIYGEIGNINIAVIAYILSVMLSLIISFVFLKNSIKQNQITEISSSQLLKMGLPLLFVASMGLFLSITDSMMLAYWLDSSIVGIYGILAKIVFLSSMLLFVVNSIVAPKIASAYDQKEYFTIYKILKKSILFLSIVALVILSTFFLLSENILSVFGTEFIAGRNALLILALGQFFVLATGPVEYMLIMTGKEKQYRNIVIISAILNIILNICLIPKYHMIGASIATATSLIIKNVLTAIVVYSFLQKLKYASK